MDRSIVDSGVHQWTFGKDLTQLKSYLSPDHQYRESLINRNEERPTPLSGTFMPTLPWYHAFWNEDALEGSSPESNPGDRFSSPEWMDEHLAEQGVDTAILAGHEIRFLPGLIDPDYKAQLCAAYNEILVEEWLTTSDRLKGGIVVSPADPDAAAEEIRTYANHDDVVTVILFGGGQFPLGHDRLLPIYEAASTTGLPVTIYTSGNPVHRQTALGVPDHYVTRDANLVQNHMSNLSNMVLNGVFKAYPNLKVIWAGEGVAWAIHSMWRTTRRYREYFPTVPTELPKSPKQYVKEQCYFTTYPLGLLDADIRTDLYEMVGVDNILYASGYPLWDHDLPADLDGLSADTREKIFHQNAQSLYGL